MPNFAANLTMMFNEVDFMDRFAAAAAAGFKGVEYLFPYDWAAADLRSRLEEHGLTQVLHNLPAGDWGAGDRGLACDAGRVDEFKAGIDKALEYATALGCTQLNCLAGIVPDGVDVSTAHDTFLENLGYAAPILKSASLRLLIEPINTRDIPGFFLNGTAQAAQILDEVGSDNLFIQHDLYHMQVMEGDLAPTLDAHIGRISHIQLADTPGRHEPGTGEINYPFLFDHLDTLGYDRWIGCEYKPQATTEAGLGWIKPYL